MIVSGKQLAVTGALIGAAWYLATRKTATNFQTPWPMRLTSQGLGALAGQRVNPIVNVSRGAGD